VGDQHDGRNQFQHPKKEGKSTSRPAVAVNLAFSEGVATWAGMSLLALVQTDRPHYKAIIDLSSTRWPELEQSKNDWECYGEDAEDAIAQLLWDLTDPQADRNTRTQPFQSGLKDQFSEGFSDIWATLTAELSPDKASLFNISNYWTRTFIPNYPLQQRVFLKPRQKVTWDIAAATKAAETFAEFGMCQVLQYTGTSSPTLSWTQLTTSVKSLKQDVFWLVVLTEDLGYVLMKKRVKGNSYVLRQKDFTEINAALSSAPSDVKKGNPAYLILSSPGVGIAPFLSNVLRAVPPGPIDGDGSDTGRR
jgi:hypothetical protein